MDEIIGQLQIVLPILAVIAILVRPTRAAPVATAGRSEPPVFHLRNAKFGVDARAQQLDGEFTLLQGSVLVAAWHGVGKATSTMRAYASYRNQHGLLLADGALVLDPMTGGAQLTRDVVFPSPSTAGAVALGRSCNGRVEWVSADGQPFGVWESRGVE